MNSINEKYRQMYISSDVKFYTISELTEMLVGVKILSKNYLMTQNFRHLILEE